MHYYRRWGPGGVHTNIDADIYAVWAKQHFKEFLKRIKANQILKQIKYIEAVVDGLRDDGVNCRRVMRARLEQYCKEIGRTMENIGDCSLNVYNPLGDLCYVNCEAIPAHHAILVSLLRTFPPWVNLNKKVYAPSWARHYYQEYKEVIIALEKEVGPPKEIAEVPQAKVKKVRKKK